MVFLPIIDLYSEDKTCIFSTLQYLCKIASDHNVPAVVTFDQPLYWKASQVKHEVPEDSPIHDVILLLGCFHTVLNLQGAIGTLKGVSGINEILGTVYGENAVLHILSGKAVQRALRGHLLIDQCLTQQVLNEIIRDDPDFEKLMTEIECLYMQTLTGNITLNSIASSACLGAIDQALFDKRNEFSTQKMDMVVVQV